MPDTITPGLGHNNPPDPIEILRAQLVETHADLMKRSRELLDLANRADFFRRVLTGAGTHERFSGEWMAEAFLKTTGGDPKALLLLRARPPSILAHCLPISGDQVLQVPSLQQSSVFLKKACRKNSVSF